MPQSWFGAAAVLLVTIATASAQPPVKGPPGQVVSPDGSPILAEGPLPVSVTLREKRSGNLIEEKGTLLFLTQRGIYYRVAKSDRMVGRPSNYYSFAAIETTEKVALAKGGTGLAYWSLDAKADPPVFKGDQLPVAIPDLTPRLGKKSEEQNWFLLHSLSRLQSRVDSALRAGDEQQIEFCTRRATAIADYIATNRLDQKLGAAYAELPKYVARQTKLADELEKLFADQLEKRKELIERAREAEAKRRQQELVGTLQLFGSFFQTADYDVYYTDGSVRRESMLEPDLFGMMAGFGQMGRARAEFQGEMSRLTVAKAAFEAQALKKYTAAQDKMAADRAARAESLRKVATDQFKLAPDVPLDRLADAQKQAAKEKSAAPVVALYEEQAKYEKGTGPWDNPYALCDLYDAKARAVAPKSPTRGNDMFALAQQAVEAARLVPQGELFDFERTQLLRIAAQLACRAAIADLPHLYWCRGYSPRAAFAVRVIDLAGPLDRLDPTGEIREQRALALLLVGRVDAALAQAEAVGKLRATSGSYHFNLARIQSAQFLVDEANDVPEKLRPKHGAIALASLETALKYGFTDVRDIQRDSDFFSMVMAPESKDRVAKITRLSVTYTIIPPPKAGDPVGLRVTNNSAFNLTNLTGTFEMFDSKGAPIKPDGTLTPPSFLLRPGREVVFQIPSPMKSVARRRLSVQCDQGKTVANETKGP